MPGNLVVINGSPDLTFYVGDSKMPKLMKLLKKIGHVERNDGSLATDYHQVQMTIHNKHDRLR